MLLGNAHTVRDNTIDDFKKDLVAFESLQDHYPKPELLSDLLERSTFNLPKTKQWVAAFRESGWQATADVVDLGREKAEAISSSLPCEEMIHFMKNSKRQKGTKRLRRPQRCMATVISQSVLQKRFHFDAFPVDHVVPRKYMRLSENTFQAKPQDEDATVCLEGIATRKQKAPYYTCTAADLGRPAADLVLLRQLHRDKDFSILDRFSMNLDCSYKYKFIWRRQDSDVGHIGFFNYSTSAAIAWEVQLCSYPERPMLEYVKFDMARSKPLAIAFFEWDSIVVRRTEWHSWAWLCYKWPQAPKHAQPALRMYVDGAELPLLKAAAAAAWRGWQNTDLESIAAACRIPITSGATTFELLFDMTKYVLKCTDAEVLNILKLRLATLQPQAEAVDTLLEVEEAQEVLEKSDGAELEREKEAHRSAQASFDSFSKDFGITRREVRGKYAAAAGPKAKAKAKAKFKAKPPCKLPLEGRIEHTFAKQYMPDGAKLWQSRRSGCWNCKVPPLPRAISRSWARYGQAEALFLVIKEAWKLHCVVEGLSPDECPMEGVFFCLVEGRGGRQWRSFVVRLVVAHAQDSCVTPCTSLDVCVSYINSRTAIMHALSHARLTQITKRRTCFVRVNSRRKPGHTRKAFCLVSRRSMPR